MLPDINSLALFVRAAEMQSLTKAAEASHIGLAAASRRMTLLEHCFKVTLLERTPHGVRMTQAGMSLLEHAKTMLACVDQMRAAVGEHASGCKGALRILGTTSALSGPLPEDLATFGRSHPEMRLVVEERSNAEIVRSLGATEADLGVVSEVETPGLTTWRYRTARLAIVMPPAHTLAREPEVRFEHVLDYELLTLEENTALVRRQTQHVVTDRIPSIRGQVRCIEALLRLVQAGFGIGLLPLHAAAALKGAGRFLIRPLVESWAEHAMLICIKSERVRDRPLALLARHLAAARVHLAVQDNSLVRLPVQSRLVQNAHPRAFEEL